MKMYVWRDALDKDMYSIGYRNERGNPVKVSYTAWGQLFTDGFHEIFGDNSDITDDLKVLKVGEVLCIEGMAKSVAVRP